MRIQSYLNLYEVLISKGFSREENRAFGLSHAELKDKPIAQVIMWSEMHKHTLNKPLLSETFSSYLYSMTFILVILAFILGLLSGVGLLSYNGKEPVNVIYFMVMVIAFPLFTMLLSLVSMLRANITQSSLVHVSPAFWMEKLLYFLPKRMQENIEDFKINPLLSNWLVIQRAQLLALFFSLGLLVALLGVVATKDIAFSWSTTLNVTGADLHQLLLTLAFTWKDVIPSAVPSLSLIEQSQYFRLGEGLSKEMINNASKLGQWWKFLAMATLFYALFLRFILWFLAYIGLHRAIKKSILMLTGVQQLLHEMNDPSISTYRLEEENVYKGSDEGYTQIVYTLDSSYDVVQGWAMHYSELLVLRDTMGIISPYIVDVGGANSLEEDTNTISKCKGEVVIFVKAWEPPTMDFVDFLEELSPKVDKVIVVPVGTVDDSYRVVSKYLDIWSQKLVLVSDEKVWLKC